MENEYARILMEQGVIGLALTLLFLLWYATRGTPLPGLAIQQSVAWRGGRKIARASSLFLLSTGLIGIGIFVSIPQAVLLFLCIGWVAAGAPWVPVRSSDDAGRFTRPVAFLWPRRATAGLV
jgi:hypothetical protein